MKLIQLSLVAVLAASSVFAGGEIAPVEPTVEVAAAKSATTIEGKATLYYYSHDDAGASTIFDSETAALGAGVTLDVSHTLLEGVTANFSAVGTTNITNNWDFFEDTETTGFFNVANITATFADTTLIAGRQLLSTPMLTGYDWLLAPGSFEAYTIANKSIQNVTLIGSYVTKYRGNNTGPTFEELDGDNYALGGAYSDTFDISLWYYNIDAGDYTQFYADAGTEVSGVKVAGQFASTDYGTGPDSSMYGAKASTTLSKFDLSAAYNHIEDAPAGYIGVDSLYTTSWNNFASNFVGDSFKIGISTEISGISGSVSYADYEAVNLPEDVNEFDLILGYNVTDVIAVGAVYSNTKYGETLDADNALEVYATYKF